MSFPINSRALRQGAITIALLTGLVGWVAIGRVELSASDSTRAAIEALEQVEKSVRTSTGLADSTADALDAAATSLDSAAGTSDAVADVARDVAAVTASLRPVVQGTSDALTQIDSTLNDVGSAISSLPFAPDLSTSSTTLGQIAEDVAPLDDDLVEAELSLQFLAAEADQLGPDSRELAEKLRFVANDLRASSTDLTTLADDVAQTRNSLDDVFVGEKLNLLPVQVLLALVCLALILTNVAALQEGAALQEVRSGQDDEAGS